MPIYEYQCSKCGYIFEEITHNMDVEKISTECPVCESPSKKIISGGTLFTIHGFNSNNGYAGHNR
jgi:putative FmdB family regulatory protein